jgi:type IV pilus assembly protein PilB
MLDGEKLLIELTKRGLLDDISLNKIKRESLLSGKTVEDLIHERRLIDDQKIAEVKGEILKVPYYKVDFDNFDQSVLELIPEETVRTYGTAPILKKDDLLVVGMIHPDDVKAQEALKFIAHRQRLNLGIYLITYGDWLDILRKYSPYKTELEAAVKALNLKPGEGGRKIVSLADSKVSFEEAPIIRIVSDTLQEAVQSGASDVHIEPQENYLRVRFRIDGELEEGGALPVELSGPVISRIKIMSNLKIDESRIPQDGRFRTKIFDREIDFRVSTFPTPLGEKVAVRVLDPTTGLKTFDQLGLVGKNLDMIKSGLNKPFGMIIMSGPTGSGKTTTLYSLLQVLNKESVNIVSLEDPVEYFVPGVNQSQIRPEIGYDFASGLRQILRQDPDIIMVGEMRDSETAGLAVQAALTGHIVLSTLHTNNSIGVIPRLIDMKVEPFLLPSSLNLMAAQRLVVMLCQSCKVAEEASPIIQKIIKDALSGIPKELTAEYKEPYQIYHSPGCQKCKGRGVAGRIAIVEVFQMTSQLEEIIFSGPTSQKILAEAKRQGMMTLREDGVLKALKGLVSIEDVARESEEG